MQTNSKNHNTTVYVYEGVTFQEIDDTVEKVVYAYSSVEGKIENPKSHCQKCVIQDSIVKTIALNELMKMW